MLKKLISLVVLIVAVMALTGCTANREPEAPVAEASQEPEGIRAEAKVVPVRSATLSLSTSGAVTEVLVREGQQIEAGQVILRVDGRRQAAAVAQAEANVLRAQAALAELKAGSRAEEIAQAGATVEAAQARLARLQEGARAEDIAAASAVVATARAELQRVQEGTSAQQLAAADAELANARAALAQAQAAYDRVKDSGDIGTRPEALNLERATNAMTAAQARYDDLARGATPAAIAAARGRLQQAEAQLAGLQAAASPAEVAAANAEVRRATAQLELLRAGARPERIAAAEADLATVEAALEQAKVALSETELQAPFAGTVASLPLAVGEQAAPGAPAVVLADLSGWLIETTDLTEMAINGVREGAQTTISFDALPGVELSGTVSSISPVGENRQGDIVYTVTVRPDQQDSRLRWNMIALVTIAQN